MKKSLLYFFLATYSIVMFKPIAPYIKDFVAHLLFFEDHMLTVHAHNGKFHVHAEVEEASKNDQPGKSTNDLKKDVLEYEQIFVEGYELPVIKISTGYSALACPFPGNTYLDYDFPPPRV